MWRHFAYLGLVTWFHNWEFRTSGKLFKRIEHKCKFKINDTKDLPKGRWLEMCSLFATTGGSVQSRKYSWPVFSGLSACNRIFKRTVVPWVSSCFQVRLRSDETKGLFCFFKGGLKWQWVWYATAVSMIIKQLSSKPSCLKVASRVGKRQISVL